MNKHFIQQAEFWIKRIEINISNEDYEVVPFLLEQLDGYLKKLEVNQRTQKYFNKYNEVKSFLETKEVF